MKLSLYTDDGHTSPGYLKKKKKSILVDYVYLWGAFGLGGDLGGKKYNLEPANIK